MDSNKKTNMKLGFYNLMDKKYKELFSISTRFIIYWVLFGLIEYGFLTDAQKETRYLVKYILVFSNGIWVVFYQVFILS